MITFNYICAFFLIVLGFYTIVTQYNLVKTVIGMSMTDMPMTGFTRLSWVTMV